MKSWYQILGGHHQEEEVLLVMGDPDMAVFLGGMLALAHLAALCLAAVLTLSR